MHDQSAPLQPSSSSTASPTVWAQQLPPISLSKLSPSATPATIIPAGVTMAMPVVQTASIEPSAAASTGGGGGGKPKYHSEIECGVMRKNGLRVYKLRHKFFGDMEIEVFTAKVDPKRRMLFRPADLALKLGFPATRIGMYLHRRKSKILGIFQATNFSYKLTGITGLKTGSYFISLDVCKKIEKDYFQKNPEDGDDGSIEHSFTDDEEGITMEVITEKAYPAATLISPRFVVGSSQVLVHDPRLSTADGYSQPTYSGPLTVPSQMQFNAQPMPQYSFVTPSVPQSVGYADPNVPVQFNSYPQDVYSTGKLHPGYSANFSNSSHSSSTLPSPQVSSYSYVQQSAHGPVYIVESSSSVPHAFSAQGSRTTGLGNVPITEQHVQYVPRTLQQIPPVLTSADMRIFPQSGDVRMYATTQQVPALSASTSGLSQHGQWIVADPNYSSTATPSTQTIYFTRQ